MIKYIETQEAQIASPEDVLNFLQADECRLVFRRLKCASMNSWQEREKLRHSGSGLYFLEYRRGADQPVWNCLPEIKAFAPLFSPDGSRVVFSATFLPSEMFVLPLESCQPVSVGFGAHPHWWVDPKSGQTWVIFRTENGLYTGFPRGKTLRQQIGPDHQPLGEPEEICAYGFGGGITPDGRFLATGYTHLIVADLETGEFFQPLGDRQLPDGENQVCDVSVSPDDSRRVMHLRLTEFGEGRHDFFGFCGFDGSHYVKVMKPLGTLEWQTPEWSTHPDFAAAVATRSDQTYDIYLIRLSTQDIFRLTCDGGYGHVHLWMPSQPAV